MIDPQAVSFTLPGRVMGKLRWGGKRKKGQHLWGKAKSDERARAYIAECNRIRAAAWEGRADTSPLPPYLLGVAVFLNPAKSGPNKGTFGNSGSDYDNIRGTILDALQGCLLCQRKAKGRGKCKCAKPRILLIDDSPAWYRGVGDAVEADPWRLWRSRCYLTAGDERVCVTLEPDTEVMEMAA